MKRVNEILDARNLGAVIGGDWEGWSWAEGKILAPDWREGVGPDDIRTLPYLDALTVEFRRAHHNYEKEIALLRDKLATPTRNEQYYRKQLRIVAKLGGVLQRIAG